MIGLDFPVKPEWIHDVHHLWQPEQPISELVQAALSQTMLELGGEKTRRNSLGIIIRYFVSTSGGGQSRRTIEKDVWVSFSLAYPVTTMAPAYLAHLTGQNEVAQEISKFLACRNDLGDIFTSSELRQHVSAVFGQRKVVTNAASAFLRTLISFGVLSAGQRQGEYQFAGKHSIPAEVFPLIVWSWWQTHPTPQIDLDTFVIAPSLAFLQTENLNRHWGAYQTTLWGLEERLDGRRATLRYVEAEFFENALLQLLV